MKTKNSVAAEKYCLADRDCLLYTRAAVPIYNKHIQSNRNGEKLMREFSFYSTPFGVSGEEVPYAAIAKATTSRELVSDQESDAFYFRSLEADGIFLNEAQIEAVRFGSGPLLALAGAGSGKTSVLVCRAGYLMAVKQVPAESVLLITFTKKAAEEMKTRVMNLPGIGETASNLQVRTFHAFFLLLLRRHGIRQEIVSSERKKQLAVKLLMKDMGLEDVYQPEAVLSFLSYHKMNDTAVADLPEKETSQKQLKRICQAYEDWKLERNYIDFDDILMKAKALMDEDPAFLQQMQDRFEYVMVDEFQDTNYLQYRLVQMIVEKHRNLFVVGDDDQTIYSFNGARHEFILEFDQKYPEAQTIVLDVNYRSHKAIAGLGNEVVRHNKQRKSKTLQVMNEEASSPFYFRAASTDEEAEQVVADMKRAVAEGECEWRDMAVLHRTISVSRAIFEQLTAQDVPFVHHSLGNQMFYEQWPVKAMMDYLRLSLNPTLVEAMPEVVPTLFISRERGMRHIKEQEVFSPRSEPLLHLTDMPGIRPFQRKKVEERQSMIQKLKEKRPETAIRQMRRQFYDGYLEADEQQVSMKKETLKETLDELESSAKRFESVSSFVYFVDDMLRTFREMKEREKDPDANHVSLMTIHRAKGMEFPVVYVIGASETIMPHDSALKADRMKDLLYGEKAENKQTQALEEERRLAYVAITRAKKKLCISSPAFYRGKEVEVSRFLLEAFPGETHTGEKQETETIDALVCEEAMCPAWIRLSEAPDVTEKECPMCKGKMVPGTKQVIKK